MTNLRHRLFAGHLDGDIHEVTNDAVDLAADVADLGELGCLDLDKRRFRQLGQAPRYFGLADTGRADHQDVLWRDFAAQRFVDLHPAPAIPSAIATARLASSWPTMCLSSSWTISLGVICDMLYSVVCFRSKLFDSDVLVGVDADVAGDLQGLFDDVACFEIRVLQQAPARPPAHRGRRSRSPSGRVRARSRRRCRK